MMVDLRTYLSEQLHHGKSGIVIYGFTSVVAEYYETEFINTVQQFDEWTVKPIKFYLFDEPVHTKVLNFYAIHAGFPSDDTSEVTLAATSGTGD